MDVEQAAAIALDKFVSQDAHESGEDDKIGYELVDGGGKRAVEGLPVGKREVIDDRGANAALRCDGKARGFRAVADDADDASRNRARMRGVDDRRHVRAASGDEDHQPLQSRRGAVHVPTVAGVSGRRPSTLPITRADSPSAAKRESAASASRCATTSIKPIPQLNTRRISSSATLPWRCSQSKIGGRAQSDESMRAESSGGNMRCAFS